MKTIGPTVVRCDARIDPLAYPVCVCVVCVSRRNHERARTTEADGGRLAERCMSGQAHGQMKWLHACRLGTSHPWDLYFDPFLVLFILTCSTTGKSGSSRRERKKLEDGGQPYSEPRLPL